MIFLRVDAPKLLSSDPFRIWSFGESMPRFKLGDRIKVIPTNSAFSGVPGIVEEIVPHPKNLSQLDSYVVRFAWGERQKFWDAELESAETKPKNDSSAKT